jgi:hypothetical protein
MILFIALLGQFCSLESFDAAAKDGWLKKKRPPNPFFALW